MNKEEKNIIIKAKKLINQQGKVALVWLIDSEMKLNKGINYADNIACKLEEGMKYIRYDAHNPKDIFVKKNPSFISFRFTRIIAWFGAITGFVSLILKLAELCRWL